MILLTLGMSDAVYEKLRCGINMGLFKFSLDNLSDYDIKVVDVKRCED
jgi:hypothetical protein